MKIAWRRIDDRFCLDKPTLRRLKSAVEYMNRLMVPDEAKRIDQRNESEKVVLSDTR